jgi:hypothetical protein
MIVQTMIVRTKIRPLMLLPIMMLVATLITSRASAEDRTAFPDVPEKFGSATFSYPIHDELIVYGGKIRLLLADGALYRRRDSIVYDYFYIGSGELQIVDTALLNVGWRQQLGGRRKIAFKSAYLCGKHLPEAMHLDPAKWRKDKLRRPEWKKLQFLVKAPDKYFGISLPGELGLWPDRDGLTFPIWADLQVTDNEQMVVYVSPDLSDQLNLYLYDNKFSTPYLLADGDMSRVLNLSPIRIDSTEISIELRESGRFVAVSDIYISPGNTERGIGFILPALHEVDSVRDAHGNPLDFIKENWRTSFYVAPRPNYPDRPDKISVYFRGKFIQARYEGTDFPANVATWFPHVPERQLGKYTIHYTQHKDLDLISVGTKIGDTVVGDKRTVSFTTDNISYISFSSGVYDTLRDSAGDIPLTFFVRKENNRGLFNRDIPLNIMTDLQQACSSFVTWWGPPLAPAIRIVDYPWGKGLSSPGLIHLSDVTFRTSHDQARFRAHEMAHQWWGHTVVPMSFSEVWLSEGLAEFSAAMYVLNVRHDSTEFDEITDRWGKQVTEEGRLYGHYSRGYRAGPITMGSRFLQSYSPGDYIALVYSKAACLLRMLRFELDGPQYHTDFFDAMLAEYRRTYFGQQVTNADFIRIAAKYIGDIRAGEFFAQWLYGWRIPSFVCRYKIEPDDKGRPMLHVSIDVSDVDSSFSTPFPVEIETRAGKRQLVRLDNVGQQHDFVLGPFPPGIKKVRFDPDHIILARETKVIEP